MGLYVSAMFVFLALCSSVVSISVVNMAISPENVRFSFEPYLETFGEFKATYEKIYKSEDAEAHRYSVFVENVKQMEEHNLKYQTGETTYYMNVNKFSDMTHDEYLAYNGLDRYANASSSDNITCGEYVPRESRPDSIDWRDKGAVTPVKDQKLCGSCWTFSATGAIEGQNFINTGVLQSFSEQQIVDCCMTENCGGCDGGLMNSAFEYANQTGGLELESDYRYTGNSGDTCTFNASKVKVEVTACYNIPEGQEIALQDAVGNVGPIAVAVDATRDSFMSYAGGIYDEPQCNSTKLSHAILVVGYGSLSGTDYWMIKNSWDPNWGIKGYMMMRRNHQNLCGIATLASFPLTAQP